MVGQTIVEYILIIVLIALVLVIALGILGNGLVNALAHNIIGSL